MMFKYAFLANFLSFSSYAMYGYGDHEAKSLHPLEESYGEGESKSRENKKESFLLKSDQKEPNIITENLNVIEPYFAKAFYVNKYDVSEDYALDHYIRWGHKMVFFPSGF